MGKQNGWSNTKSTYVCICVQLNILELAYAARSFFTNNVIKGYSYVLSIMHIRIIYSSLVQLDCCQLAR